MMSPPLSSRKKNPLYTRARGIIGALVLIGIAVASRLHIPFSPCVFLRVDPVILACPLGTLEVTLAGHGLIWNLIPGFIILCLLMMLLGRMWCGWVCPAHLAGHALGNACSFIAPTAAKAIKKGRRNTAERIAGRLHLGRIHVLGFVIGLLIGAWLFRYPLWSIICPLGVVSRSLIECSVHLHLRWDLIFLILPVLVMFLFRFGWKCACPVGLLYGMLSTANRTVLPSLSPTPEKSCKECGACRTACPVGLSPFEQISSFDCMKCLRCIEHCPHKALCVRFAPPRIASGEKSP